MKYIQQPQHTGYIGVYVVAAGLGVNYRQSVSPATGKKKIEVIKV